MGVLVTPPLVAVVRTSGFISMKAFLGSNHCTCIIFYDCLYSNETPEDKVFTPNVMPQNPHSFVLGGKPQSRTSGWHGIWLWTVITCLFLSSLFPKDSKHCALEEPNSIRTAKAIIVSQTL